MQQRNVDEMSESDRRFLANWTVALLAIHGGLVLLLIGLAISYPDASARISQAVEAEYLVNVPQVPTQIAQPRREIRTTGQLEANAQR